MNYLLRAAVLVVFAVVVEKVAVAAAPGWQRAVDDAQRQNLAADPQWLRLLHFEGQRSEVLSEDFFLAANGRESAEAELIATVRAYFRPFDAESDQHPRCRFPARYFWLSKRIDLPGYDRREPRCKRLQEWVRLDELRSASLLMVSGYFGNPASTFGHSLLRFNTGEPTDGSSTLLDLTFNFGAMVPPNEWVPVYIFKGIFGGYQAGFSDSQYYTQDLVYARTEFRDMWEYELALSEDELHLLAFHLWETVGKKFTYYFLNKNCAYRLAELTELATGKPLTTRSTVWYAPVELFHRLHDANTDEGAPLFRSVRFIPSAQRVLYQRFSELDPAEAGTANHLILANSDDIGAAIAPYDQERRIAIVDALLAYYEYKLAAADDEAEETLRDAKDKVVLARLQLPARKGGDPEVPALDSPALGSAPMRLGAGIGWSDDDTFTSLRWTQFDYDLIGLNSLKNNELVALDLSVGIDDDEFFLERLDLIRARKLNTSQVPLVGESRLSWNVRVGIERNHRAGSVHTDGVVQFGIARATRFSTALDGYLGVDGWLQTGAAPAAVDPNFGLITRSGRWKAWLRGGARYDIRGDNWYGHAELSARYQLSQHRALRFEATHDRESRVVLSFNYYL